MHLIFKHHPIFTHCINYKIYYICSEAAAIFKTINTDSSCPCMFMKPSLTAGYSKKNSYSHAAKPQATPQTHGTAVELSALQTKLVSS